MFLLSLFVFICHNFFICCSLLIYIYICTCGASPCLSPRVCVCVFVIVSFFSCTLSFQPTTHTICEWDFSSTDLLFIQYYDYIIRIYEEDLHIKKKKQQ
ncbi:hypothetical protein DPX39_090006600 [Trypanosoma brucei equiperdum]|uniref:Uncharacterized protein n=1 Tax=Trypanosoma brucei equiperdum TaxID=630700 RepID=A0A3L6L5H3_9TRYP|nr:hypothetical protein DPX39_090006600 [Trypanosoma brucei equiperdum]